MFVMRENDAMERLCPLSFGPDQGGTPTGDRCIGARCAWWRFRHVSAISGPGGAPQESYSIERPISALGLPAVDAEGVCLGMPTVHNNLVFQTGAR